jgi:hypothetical protein
MVMNRNDVTSSIVEIVDAERWEAREVLTRIDPMRSFADRLSALGLDDRAIWCKRAEELSYSLVWRFGADGGSARVDWRLSLDTDAAGRTELTVRLAGRGSDAPARGRLLSSWTLLEELAQGHARRLARMLDDYANADDYEYQLAPAQLRAAV